MRGEHTQAKGVGEDQKGSPPRAWGTRNIIQVVIKLVRITPTCVGNTQLTFPPCPAPSDHPHVRGEHKERIFLDVSYKGSPPRAWGTPAGNGSHPGCRRITPTCVGNTWQGQDMAQGGQDHPHVRGEHERQAAAGDGVIGSPPRAWGTLIVVVILAAVLGITPTCVGNTNAAA